MKSFKCPECRGQNECGSLILEPSMEFFEPGKKPHQYETHFIPCCDCRYFIPDRLAYSSNDEEFEKYKVRWIKDFKPYAKTIESFHDEL